MLLATGRDGTLDGTLLVVAPDAKRALPAGSAAPTLVHALQHWGTARPRLEALAERLRADAHSGEPFDPAACTAPLPRAPQWLDGSAFLHHGRLLERAFGNVPAPDADTVPLMYQGASDDFLGPHDDVLLPAAEDGTDNGIDFEGEFGVIVDDVPMGTPPAAALAHVRLVVLLNDWSLRRFGPREMRTGFGFLQAKPSTAFAPLAVTPDELGGAWRDGRVQLDLHVSWNGQPFGRPNGGAMDFHFGELIAHAARTRRLRAGTIIGSGTVSNDDAAAGSACIAERRVLEMLQGGGTPRTPFMAFGDTVRLEARQREGDPGPFGGIEQRVVQAPPPPAAAATAG